MTLRHPFRAPLWGLILVLAGLLLGLPLIAAQGDSNNDNDEDTRSEQVIEGDALYREHCAQCHGVGEEGESRSAPKLIGEGHPLRVYGTAHVLYNYTSLTMPFDKPGVLEEDEYWAIIAFMLHANELLPEDTELGPDNAEAFSLRRD